MLYHSILYANTSLYHIILYRIILLFIFEPGLLRLQGRGAPATTKCVYVHIYVYIYICIHIYIYIYIYIYLCTHVSGDVIWVLRDTGVCVCVCVFVRKQLFQRRRALGHIGSQSTKPGAGEQFLPNDCKAKVRVNVMTFVFPFFLSPWYDALQCHAIMSSMIWHDNKRLTRHVHSWYQTSSYYSMATYYLQGTHLAVFQPHQWRSIAQ